MGRTCRCARRREGRSHRGDAPAGERRASCPPSVQTGGQEARSPFLLSRGRRRGNLLPDLASTTPYLTRSPARSEKPANRIRGSRERGLDEQPDLLDGAGENGQATPP